MDGWGWKRQRGPSRRPLSKAEIEDLKDKRHIEAEATKLLRAQRKAKRRQLSTEVDAMVRSGDMISAPSNQDLVAEHLANKELRRQVDDLMAADPEVTLAINQAGQGGAFVLPRKYDRKPNLIRQWVAGLSAMFARPLDTNRVTRVISAKKPR